MRKTATPVIIILVGMLLALGLVGTAHGQLQVPPNFIWQVFSVPYASPKHSAIDRPGGQYGGQMYIAELGGGVVSVVNPAGGKGPFSPPPGGPPYAGPVGIAFDRMGLFGGLLYVSETAAPNLWQVLPNGAPMLFSAGLNGSGGIAFDPLGPYGGFCYAAQWAGGPGPLANSVMFVNPAGMAAVFVPPGLLADPRYLEFDTSPGLMYGGLLYVSEFGNGNITPVMPNSMVLPPIANCLPGIEGIAFALGDPYFGPWMYTANLPTGQIWQVLPGGPAVLWGVCQTGAAYIQFVPAGQPFSWNNLPTMYLDDGNGTIYVIGPNPATPVTPATWGQIKALF